MITARKILCLVIVFTLAGAGNALAFTSPVRIPPKPSAQKAPAKAPAAAVRRAPAASAARAFDSFQRTFGGVQGVEWSKDSLSPRSVWGFKSVSRRGSTASVARTFLSGYRSLFGTDGSDLKTLKVTSRLGYRHIMLQQFREGVPVDGATVAVHMTSAGRVVGVDSTYKTGLNVDETKSVPKSRALAAVKSKLGKTAKPVKAQLVVRPIARGKADLAYKVTTDVEKPRGHWTHLVDASTGKIVSSYNDIRYAASRPARVSARLGSSAKVTALPVAPPASFAPKSAGVVSGWNNITSTNFDVWPTKGWRRFWIDGWDMWQASWGKTTYRRYGSGGYSIWPASAGPDALNPSIYYYPGDLDAWAVFGPFDLSTASEAELKFKVAYDTEENWDWYSWMASVDGDYFYGWRVSGQNATYPSFEDTITSLADGKTLLPFDLTSVPILGNVAGESKIWIAIRFDSDTYILGEQGHDGPFVDNLVLRKFLNASTSGTTSGTVQGYVFPSTGADVQALAPMSRQHILVGWNRTMTGTTGTFRTGVRGNIVTWLKGPYCVASNEDTEVATFATPSTALLDHTWSYGGSDTHADEVNLYYHVNKIHDYYATTLGFSGMNYPIRALSHMGDYDDPIYTDAGNAFYDSTDGNIYFGEATPSYGVNDTAKSADVIYHEYTHGVCDHILDLPYVVQPGAMSEGYADYFAASFTNDPDVGNWVFTDPSEVRNVEYGTASHEPTGNMTFASQEIRNSVNDATPTADWWGLDETVAPSFVSDPDVYNDGGWVHHNSMVFSGFLWDVRSALQATYGADAGKLKADKITLESLYFWPYSLESGKRAMKIADDVLYDIDNNWLDGSPNAAAIDAAAALHGFPDSDPGSRAVSLSLYRSPTSPRVNRYMTGYGYVAPHVVDNPAVYGGSAAYGPKMKVFVYRYYAGKYRLVWTYYPRLVYNTGSYGGNDGRSKYAVSFKPTRRGRWLLRSYFPGSAYNSPSFAPKWSGYLRFTVY